MLKVYWILKIYWAECPTLPELTQVHTTICLHTSTQVGKCVECVTGFRGYTPDGLQPPLTTVPVLQNYNLKCLNNLVVLCQALTLRAVYHTVGTYVAGKASDSSDHLRDPSLKISPPLTLRVSDCLSLSGRYYLSEATMFFWNLIVISFHTFEVARN